MESTICLLTEWTQKASGHFKVDSVFLIKKGACVEVKNLRFIYRESLDMFQKALLMPSWTCGSRL